MPNMVTAPPPPRPATKPGERRGLPPDRREIKTDRREYR